MTSSFRPLSRLLALSWFCLTAQVGVAETADYWIVERPGGLTIFDRYERQLASARLDEIPPHSAFEIVAEETVLGDQISQAAHVRLGELDYYFLRDDSGELMGKARAGAMRRLRNCEVLNDTVTAARTGAIRFVSRGAARGLEKGAVMIRFFRHGGRTYCLRPATREVGWCEGASSGFARAQKPAKPDEGAIPEGVARRIRRRFEAANESYRSYFAFFNAKTGKDKSAPEWLVEETADMMRFTLKASPGCDLESSTEVLVREIEGVVRGEGLEVAAEGEVVEVRPGNE